MNSRTTNPIQFYFDFSSPYGYFSSEKIEALAKRCSCTVSWQPYLMGAVMRVTGRKPLIQIPLLDDYSRRDLKRIARYQDIAFSVPSKFPIPTVSACRAYYWCKDNDPDRCAQLVHALYRAYFVDNVLISDTDAVLGIAADRGIDAARLEAALQDETLKAKVRAITDAAIKQGIFGSPFFIVDGEPFWGHDRLDQVEAWAKSGGW